MAIVPDWVHPGIRQVKHLVGVPPGCTGVTPMSMMKVVLPKLDNDSKHS